MNYNRQIQEIKNYFKDNEKTIENFKIGIEFEHFIVDKDTFKTISYYGQNGVGEILKDLEKQGWNGSYEEGYILGLKKGSKTITLEPGSQLELSIDANLSIENIEDEYIEFIKEITPILEKRGQLLMSTGYHPETKIEDIKLLPKKRYNLMFDYFKNKGKNAHNMMKGTAALQVSIDYSSEEDYRKKFRVANAISPVLYSLFDNSFYFEGEEWGRHNLRTNIWNNCDSNRAGTVEGAFEDDFGYENYAKYILNRPPIFMIKNGEVVATGEKDVRELFNPEDYKEKELEHFLTMFFPDVRTKAYIEIRPMDAVPYKLALSAVALIKGIFYDEDNLDLVYEIIKDLTIEDIRKSKCEIIEMGLKGKLKGQDILELSSRLVEIAKTGLSMSEKKYILPLEDMIKNNENPYEKTKRLSGLGKKQALEWCIVK